MTMKMATNSTLLIVALEGNNLTQLKSAMKSHHI